MSRQFTPELLGSVGDGFVNEDIGPARISHQKASEKKYRRFAGKAASICKMKGLYADMRLVTVREESLITGDPNGGCDPSA